MTLPKSPMQEEARYQALLLKKEIHEYQKLIGYGEMLQNTPNIGMIGKTPGIYSADAWNVSRQPIEGDFALDPILARTLASRFAKKITDGGWLTDYLNDRPGKGGGLGEYVKDAAFSPESILGNLNQGRQGVEAAAAQMKMNNAVKAVQSGNAQSVKLNNHMTLYNANKSGKGAPRLRLRMTGVTAKLVTPVIDPEILKVDKNWMRDYRGGRLSVRARDVQNASTLAGMTGKTRILNMPKVGGALTFAPTTAIDLYNNFNGGHFDARQFVIDEATNQSGNMAGTIATAAAGGIVVVFFGTAATATAPVILIGLILGIIVQATWNHFGLNEWAGRQGKKLLESDWADIDSRLISP